MTKITTARTRRAPRVDGETLDFLRRRKQNFQRTFMTPEGQEVLKDLQTFCRAMTTTFHPDARVAAALDGRREVWLRIQEHLNLGSEQLYVLYGGGTIPPENDNG